MRVLTAPSSLLLALCLWLVSAGAVPVAAVGGSSAVSTTTVEVFAPDGTISRVEVPVVEEAPLDPAEAAALAGSEVTPLHETGPSSNRIDLVIVGDGYTAAELDRFHDHARSKFQAVAQTEPFTTYRGFFNVWMVDVVSAESGVDNDPYPPTQRATALDMQFWCNGTERLLCVNQTKARAAAAAAPAADQILVLANSTKYGGAGGAVATSSGGNAAAGLITVHELGHSLAGLADEYDYYYRAGLAEDSTQDVTIPAPYAYYPGAVLGEPSQVNITAEADPQQLVAEKLKWWRWVGAPSPDGGTVGTFEGAGYYRYGMYRPSIDSLMHSLGIAEGGNPFNPPSSEQFVRRFHGFVQPVDAAPAQGALTPGDVELDLVELPAGQLDVRWYLDGTEVTAARGAPVFPLTADQAAAHDELTVVVADTTDFVRIPEARATELTQTLRWTI